MLTSSQDSASNQPHPTTPLNSMASITIKNEEVECTLTLTKHIATDALLELASKSRRTCLVLINPAANQITIDHKHVFIMDTYRGSLPSLQLASSTNINSLLSFNTPSALPSQACTHCPGSTGTSQTLTRPSASTARPQQTLTDLLDQRQ